MKGSGQINYQRIFVNPNALKLMNGTLGIVVLPLGKDEESTT